MISLTGILAALGALIAAIGAAWGFGRRSGAKAVRKDVAAQIAEAELQTRKRIDDAVDGASGTNAGTDREWLRARGKDQR